MCGVGLIFKTQDSTSENELTIRHGMINENINESIYNFKGEGKCPKNSMYMDFEKWESMNSWKRSLAMNNEMGKWQRR